MINHNEPPLIEPLTERENDVLRRMTVGKNNPSIAKELVITIGTVRWYAKQIYSKLGVHSRTQAVIRANNLRLFDDGDATSRKENTTPRHNLPDYALSFVGRDKEVAAIGAILRDEGKRLITVAGPGGIGKTRLCIEVARLELHQFTDGVFFMPLSAATSVDNIYPLIAKAMNLRVDREHRERLITFLKEKNVLLILDSFEHLTEGAYQLKQILNETRGVKFLVTSRITLNLSEEYSRQLKGVSLPNHAKDNVEQSTAIQLFADRAQRVRDDFSLEDNLDCVIEICRLVDGMPLAIEIATAWLKSLRCEDIAHEIRQNIDFLTHRDRTIDKRHRSIRAVFDYSWKLLTDMEKRMLQRLSMFRGGFGYAAAQQVAGATPQNLADLIDKSLLYQNSDGLYRFHDLLRQYAERRLESVETEALSTRSTMISMWSSLVRGDFGKVRKIGKGFLVHDDRDVSIIEEAFGMALLGVLSGVEGDYEQCKQLCEASRRILFQDRKMKEPISTVFTHLGLSIAACGAEDYHAVQEHVLAALQVGETLQTPAFLTLCLPLAAVVRAHDVEVETAIEYMGLAFNHKASSPAWLEQWSFLTGLRRDLKAEIGAEAFDIIWEHGKHLDLQAVCTEILREFGSGRAAVRGD
ncbi:MAG: LuxR C-terminal-related transcriptional regulator [Anaerolineae bacterium]|nr:LuxR C-terminal-related transcriptional regulator [Anaerolineae bacterium]MDQ7035618.1 LuxR C-terminal-related transcriptional regulator [Anaerolineae bacterium]